MLHLTKSFITDIFKAFPVTCLVIVLIANHHVQTLKQEHRPQVHHNRTKSHRSTTESIPLERSNLEFTDKLTDHDQTYNSRDELNSSGRSFMGELEPDGSTKIPIWNIAHMINSIDQVEQAISLGANGIETDLSFDKRGIPVEAYHGFPCDCGRHCHYREDFVKFVRYLGKSVMPGNRLSLVLFDLKLKDLNDDQKRVAGDYLASVLHEHVYQPYLRFNMRFNPPLRFVISINHVQDKVLIQTFLRYIQKNRLDLMARSVGFDIGMNDELEDIAGMWDSLNGATLNIWQGDGLTNCANIIRGVDRLKGAIEIRNSQGHFRKIYYWTADVMYQIRTVLRLGIDAVLTNQPKRVLQVLAEPEFKHKYRVATPYDDPFAQFWIRPTASGLSPPSIGEAVETVVNIQKTSTNFVRTIPEAIAATLKKVQHSLMPSS